MFSFNGTDRRVTDWGGLSLKWYGRVLGDKIIQGHLINSLIVGTSTAIIATTFGTLAALGPPAGAAAGSGSRSTR